MKNTTLIQFIAKYNLPSGEVDSAKWKVTKDGVMSVRFTSSDETCFGYVETKATGFPEGEFFIANTTGFRSLLAVLDDDIKVTTKENSTGVPIALVVSDASNKISFGLGDVRNARKNRVANAPIDDAHVLSQFTITPRFIQSFSKARGALKDVDTMTLWSDGKIVEVIIGYEQRSNSNRATLSVEPVKATAFKHINFENKYLYDILSANKDIEQGIVQVVQLPGESPFLRASFTNADFTCTYIINMKS